MPAAAIRPRRTCWVEDRVVVETPDAVLVGHMRETRHIKKVIDSLSGGRSDGELHLGFVSVGMVRWRRRRRAFPGKNVLLSNQAQLSLQMHHHRAEHWIVVRGTAQVTRGDASYLVSENESTFIPLLAPVVIALKTRLRSA